MKKLLSAALALTIGATCSVGFLAGCGKDDEKAAKEAIQYVIMQHEKDPEDTTQSYTLLGVAPVNGKNYNVSWSVSASGYNMNEYIKLSAMDEDNYTVTAKVFRSKTDVDIPYTLTATVKVGKKKASCSFSKKLVTMGDVHTVAEILALDLTKTSSEASNYYSEDGTEVTALNVKGYVVDPGTWASKNSNIINAYIADNYDESMNKNSAGTLQVYGLAPDGINITGEDTPLQKGDYVVLNGYIQIYKNAPELSYYAKKGNVTLIEFDRVEVSDAEKVAEVKNSFDISTKYFTAASSVPLTTSSKGVSISWAVDGNSTDVEIVEDTLYVKSIPQAEKDVTLIATFKCGKVTDTKQIKITLAPASDKGMTKETAFTVAEANARCEKLGSGDYYTENGTVKKVYVKGWVVDPGTWDSSFNNLNKVYIADTYSEDMNKDSEGTFYVYRIKPDAEFMKADGDIEKGDFVIFEGYLQKFFDKDANKDVIELTYNGTNNVYCAGLDKPNMTDDQKLQKALDAVQSALTITAAASGDYPLPESTIAGVTLVWATADTTYTIAGNKIHVDVVPESPATVTATVTAKIGADKTSAPKTVTITVKAAAQAGEVVLEMTKEEVSKWGTGTSYANYNGTHKVGDYNVTTSNVLANTYEGYGVMQFKASAGEMSINGEFSKIVVVFASTYAFDKANPVAVKAGETVLTASLTNTEDTGKQVTDKNNNSYALYLYTIEFTVAGSGEQTITILKDTAGAGYLTSIAFYA